MITLPEVLLLGTLLFCISVAGIFLNRKNVLILLMCIELMLLSVNINFIAFSHFLGDIHGQVFVFFKHRDTNTPSLSPTIVVVLIEIMCCCHQCTHLLTGLIYFLAH